MTNKNNDLIKYHNTPLISIFDNYGPSCFTRHMNLHKLLSPKLLLRQEKLVSQNWVTLTSFALDLVSDCLGGEFETFAYSEWATLMKGLRPEFELHGKFVCFAHTPHTHHLVGTLSNSLAHSSHETILWRGTFHFCCCSKPFRFGSSLVLRLLAGRWSVCCLSVI